jgi:hypothetical protein
MWARAALAVIVLFLVGALPYGTKTEVSRIANFCLVKIAECRAMQFAYCAVDETSPERYNFLPRNDFFAHRDLLGIPQTFLGSVILNVEAVKPASWEGYPRILVIHRSTQAVGFEAFDISGGTAVIPISNGIDFWEHNGECGRGLAACVSKQNCCFEWREGCKCGDIGIGWTNPSASIRDKGLLVQSIRLDPRISDSIGGGYTLIDLGRRGTQFCPLQISGNSTNDGGEHYNDGRCGEDTVSGCSLRNPFPAKAQVAEADHKIEPSNFHLWLGALVCGAGMFFCAACILLVIAGIQNIGLFLLAMLSCSAAVYLIAHGMFLLSLGRWALS